MTEAGVIQRQRILLKQADKLMQELEAERLRLKAALRPVAGIRERCCGQGCIHDGAREALTPFAARIQGEAE